MFDLEADLQVLAQLRAATQFTVQTLVNEAVELVSAVAAVVFPVTQQRLVHALPVPTRVPRILTILLWFSQKIINNKEFFNKAYSNRKIQTSVIKV